MQDFILYILAGGSVGFVVGMTGVGGGSFMTPILLGFGFPPTTAIGTDLLYAAITKSGGIVTHARQGSVEWKIVGLLVVGCVPASIIITLLLRHFQKTGFDFTDLLKQTLGIMLVLTSLVLLFRSFLIRERHQLADSHSGVGEFERRHAGWLTILMGIFLGVAVTLSSVGAGAFGATALMMLYPRMPMIRVIGTDLAYAVPLTAAAGFGHMQLGHVDYRLLLSLIIGSLPCIWLGTKVAGLVPEKIMQRIMAAILMLLGLKYVL
ncbi:MAG TPA: sulfite exporter TauE/SafE family protein [Gammaproteobacteria bacterium]|nr:sulfite exporter TauE/SafE family protein [Gammaproteobacteria bacterium]